MNIPMVFWLVPIASFVALGMAWHFFRQMRKEDEGTPRMIEIAEFVRRGAMAYLKQQYKVVTIVFIVLAIVFAFMAYVLKVQNPWVPFAFLTGGFFSGLAGFFGMKTATYASARTANAARKSLNSGLKVAFRSGAVMGLVVVGLGLLDIAIWFLVLSYFYHGSSMALVTITTTMLTFGMGASTQALFARVGGGIYTKAADVGADLVGKVEANIPEDDPRNPATIADNVGDNVGDVAGMGADLYESYCGSILSTAALGATAFAMNIDMQLKAVIAPMIIASVGIFLSLVGIFTVKTKEEATMRDLLRSLGLGTNVAAGLIAIATFIISLGNRELARRVVLRCQRTGGRSGDRSGYGILHKPQLQAYTAHCRIVEDWSCNGDNTGHWHWNDFHHDSSGDHLGSHNAELSLCQRLRPLHECPQHSHGSLRHRHCRRGNVVNPRHHTCHRRLWSNSRQCWRQR